MRRNPIETVAVVLPTSGRPRYLGEALSSIAEQVSAPDEVLVVDDSGELDSVRAIVRPILPKAVVFENPRTRGASSARNEGALRASSSYVAFLDDDDKWLPAYLSAMRAALASCASDVLCADFLAEIAPGTLLPEKNAPETLSVLDFLVKNPGIRASNLVIRRELFLDIGGFDQTLPSLNDLEIGVRLSQRPGVAYARVPERLVIYRQHSGSRLSTPGSEAKRVGVARFYSMHKHLMTEEERARFSRHVARLWGVDESGSPLT